MNWHDASELRAQAAWCRKLADAMSDARTRNILQDSAQDFENEAAAYDPIDRPAEPGSDARFRGSSSGGS